MPIKFTDIRPEFVGSETYLCPNEHLPTLRRLADKLTYTPSKGGSIASGGEVPLTVMLPKVDTLKIVDHNYGSLYWTCTKILMLQALSDADITKVFENVDNFKALMAKLDKDNPITRELYKNHENALYSWNTLKKYWENEILCFSGLLDAVRPKLDEVEVLHGDIRDMGTGLDFIYISNALGHSPHDAGLAISYETGKKALREGVKDVVAVSGYILCTGDGPANCPCVEVDYENKVHQGWTYRLNRNCIGKPVTARFQYMREERDTTYKRVRLNDPYSGHPTYVTTQLLQFNLPLSEYRLSPGDRQ